MNMTNLMKTRKPQYGIYYVMYIYIYIYMYIYIYKFHSVSTFNTPTSTAALVPDYHSPLVCFYVNPSPPGHYGYHFVDDFSDAFSGMKRSLTKISLKFVPKGSIDNNPALVQVKALAPNRRQAIIWTNADPVHWCIYAALGRDE